MTTDARAVESWLDRNHFLVRRLHSLTGVIPVGVFLVNHLYTNSLAALGPAGEKFDEHVHWIHSLPYLLLVEIVGVFLPLAFHAGLGVVIAKTGRFNVRQYNWLDNWRYALQRITGWIALVFILIHLAHFRFAHWFGGPPYVGTTEPFGQMQEGFFGVPWVLPSIWFLLYSIGLIASVYHFANGLCTFCITWGITVGDVARRRVAVGAFGLGVVMLLWGFLSLWAIRTKLPSERPADVAGLPAAAQVVRGG